MLQNYKDYSIIKPYFSISINKFMFISLYKENQPFAYILSIVICFLIWLPSFIKPTESFVYLHMPWQSIINTQAHHHPFVYKLLAFSLVIISGILLNFITNKYEFFPRKNNLTFLFYLLFMSLSKSFIYFNAHIISNLILIVVFYRILTIYRKDNAFAPLFDSGFLVLISSMFYLPSLGLIAMVYMALTIFHTFNLREWLMPIIGALCAAVIIVFIYYWSNTLQSKLIEKIVTVYNFPYEMQENSLANLILISVLILFACIALYKTFEGLGFYNIRIRQYMKVVLGMALVAFLLAFSIPTWTFLDFSMLCIPFAIIIANLFMHIKSKWLVDSLFFVLVLCIVIVQYHLII